MTRLGKHDPPHRAKSREELETLARETEEALDREWFTGAWKDDKKAHNARQTLLDELREELLHREQVAEGAGRRTG